jgi:uncharacterized protein YeaO (DUF488 family)
MTAKLRLKRAYEPAERGDGQRVLVDRIWPRGVSKAEAHIDLWLKEVAPSTELRRWFAHDPQKWDEFRQRYRKELKVKENLIRHLKGKVKAGTITLVYAARDEAHNSALVLKEFLQNG